MSVVVSQALKYGYKEGLKIIATIPMFDLFRVPATIFLLSLAVTQNSSFLGWIYLAGAIYLLKLGIDNLRYKKFYLDTRQVCSYH